MSSISSNTFNNLPIGVMKMGLSTGKISFMNKLAKNFFNGQLSPDGKSFSFDFEGANNGNWKEALRQHGSLQDLEIKLDPPGNGSTVWVSANMEYNHANDQVEAVLVDITRRKRAELGLQKRIELEKLVSNLSVSLINFPSASSDEATKEVLINIGTYFGAKRTGVCLLDENSGDYKLAHEWYPDDVSSCGFLGHQFPLNRTCWIYDDLATQKVVTVGGVDILNRDKEMVAGMMDHLGLHSWNSAPLISRGVVSGFVWIGHGEPDVERSSEISSVLQLIAEMIVNAVEREGIDNKLIGARDQAEEAYRIKTAFLANMSHEIRTPLTSILGFASLLADEVRDENLLDFVQLIQQSGQRLMDTLNSVLDLAQLEARGVVFNIGLFNVTDQVREILRLVKPLADEKNITLSLESDDPTAIIRIDQACIHRILMNLIGNAIKFTTQGGVRAIIKTKGSKIRISIVDSGIGISKDFLPHIFNEFSQESSGLNRSHEGSGLGLTITKRLADLMGADVTAISEQGKGSTFTVTVDKASNSISDHADEIEYTEDLKKILVVEDNWETRVLMAHMLKPSFIVETAESTEIALELAKARPYDIVLMDINLGENKSGIDVMKELRTWPEYETTPIFALTAYALPGDRERFLEIGFDAYVGKPFSRKVLFDRLEEYL